MALLVSFEFNNTRKYMHSFDLMQLQTGCCSTKHTRVLMELSPIIAVTSFYAIPYRCYVVLCVKCRGWRWNCCSLGTAHDSRSLFNNTAHREYTPICLESLFALCMLHTIEPANLPLEFTVFVNRVIGGEWEGESANGENTGYRGSFISCVSTWLV